MLLPSSEMPPALAATPWPGCRCVWLAAGAPRRCPELAVETAELAGLAELCLSSYTHCQESPGLALSAALLALGSAVTEVPELWSCQVGQEPESVLCQPVVSAAVPSAGSLGTTCTCGSRERL